MYLRFIHHNNSNIRYCKKPSAGWRARLAVKLNEFSGQLE